MEILNRFADKFSGKEKKEQETRELRKKFNDPRFLPTHEEADRAFEGKAEYDGITKSLRDHLEDPEKPGGLSFELLNQEYIHELGNYLKNRIAELKEKTGGEVTILEVGAGNGRLTHFLSQELDSQNARIIAVDKKTDKWKIKPVFPVEEIDYREALEKYNPQIIISSWMPLGEDWTREFRNTQSVDEYVLIGDNEATGRTYESWGDRERLLQTLELTGKQDSKKYEVIRFGHTPFEKDGFESKVLEGVTEMQISRGGSSGVTQSFRRK